MYPRQKLNQNISGGSVFRNAYDQASNIMHRAKGGGLEGLKESIDINGQPHNLAYINPSETNLLKVLGGSGQKVNGVPAYVTGYDEGTAGSESWSYDYGDEGVAGGRGSLEHAEQPGERAQYELDTMDLSAGYEGKGDWTWDKGEGEDADTYAYGGRGTRTAADWGALTQTQAGRDWLTAAKRSDVTSIANRSQNYLDQHMGEGLGHKAAEFFEGLGLRAHNVGLYPLEARSPGAALYRNKAAAEKAGEPWAYDRGQLIGSIDAPEIDQEFRMWLEDADPKDTIEDVARAYEAATGRSATMAVEGLGFERGSRNLAQDIAGQMNDNALDGIWQAVGILGPLIMGSPFGFINALSTTYTGKFDEKGDPITTNMLGVIKAGIGKVTGLDQLDIFANKDLQNTIGKAYNYATDPMMTFAKDVWAYGKEKYAQSKEEEARQDKEWEEAFSFLGEEPLTSDIYAPSLRFADELEGLETINKAAQEGKSTRDGLTSIEEPLGRPTTIDEANQQLRDAMDQIHAKHQAIKDIDREFARVEAKDDPIESEVFEALLALAQPGYERVWGPSHPVMGPGMEYGRTKETLDKAAEMKEVTAQYQRDIANIQQGDDPAMPLTDDVLEDKVDAIQPASPSIVDAPKKDESITTVDQDTEAPDSYSSVIAEIRKRPPVEEDLTEEEEEEKSDIADLVGLEEDIVERLSLQNVRKLLKDIYGPDYEPFTGN